MHPTFFEIPVPYIGTIPIHSYGFMMAVGFFVGILVARWRAKKEGIDPNVISDLGIYVLCAGVIGSRLFFVIENFSEYVKLHRLKESWHYFFLHFSYLCD